jgi:hypothetical protein
MAQLDLQTLLKLWMYFVTKPNWATSNVFLKKDFSNPETQQVIASKLHIDPAVVKAFAVQAQSHEKSFTDVRNAFHALAQDVGVADLYSDQWCPRSPEDLG